MKFGINTDLNMQNAIVMRAFFALYQKYCFWANFVRKIKIIISS